MYTVKPQPGHATETSFEKTSTSAPHWGHVFTASVGVRRFAEPGQRPSTTGHAPGFLYSRSSASPYAPAFFVGT